MITDPATSPENLGPLLARANLLRMRGQWADAAECCAEVLRRAPANPTAHSLLGDIYQDQGRSEEARHWYQLALELHPGSEGDRAKLARAEEMLEARQQRAEWQAIIEGRNHPVATSLLVRETVQRVIAIAGAVLCGVILVMATLVTANEQHGPEDAQSLPTLIPLRRPEPVTPETRGERDLLSKLASNTRGPYAQPVRVTLDPRGSRAVLRVFFPARAREGLTTPSYRARVLRETYRMLYDLHRVSPAIDLVEAWVVAPALQPSGRVETQQVLVVTVNSKSVWENPDTISPEKIEAVFSEIAPPWWSTDLRF